MMAEHGPSGLTLVGVARRAGVNRGTAYQHFSGREELVAAVLAEAFATTKAELDAAAPPDLGDRIDQTVRHLVDHPEIVRVSLFRLLSGVPNPREDLWKDYLDRIHLLVAGPDAQEGVDAEMLAIILVGATLLWSLRVDTGAESARATSAYIRELKRLMLFGVLRPDRHPEMIRSLAGPPPAGVRPGRRPRAAQSGATLRS